MGYLILIPRDRLKQAMSTNSLVLTNPTSISRASSMAWGRRGRGLLDPKDTIEILLQILINFVLCSV